MSLVRQDIENLKLLSALLRGDNLPEEDLKKIAGFLKSSISNATLNALLVNLDAKTIAQNELQEEAIFLVIVISHRTRFLTRLPKDLFDRINSSYDKLMKKDKLLETDMVSFSEYATALEIAALLDSLKILEKHGILKLDPELKTLHERARKGRELDDFLTKRPMKKQLKHALRFLRRNIFYPVQDYLTNLKEIVVFKMIDDDPKKKFRK